MPKSMSMQAKQRRSMMAKRAIRKWRALAEDEQMQSDQLLSQLNSAHKALEEKAALHEETIQELLVRNQDLNSTLTEVEQLKAKVLDVQTAAVEAVSALEKERAQAVTKVQELEVFLANAEITADALRSRNQELEHQLADAEVALILDKGSESSESGF